MLLQRRRVRAIVHANELGQELPFLPLGERKMKGKSDDDEREYPCFAHAGS